MNKIAWMTAMAASLALLSSANAANVGTDGAESGYASNWITGSGPTDPGAPFGTWTIATDSSDAMTGKTTSSGSTWLAFHNADDSAASHTVTASRLFNGGDLTTGQVFSYDFAYRWGKHTSTLSLMDGTTAVLSIDLSNNGTGTNNGTLAVTTPDGENDAIFTDNTAAGHMRDFHISITLGDGINLGQARVTATGGESSYQLNPGAPVASPISFDSGWFTITGSPDTLLLSSTLDNYNGAYNKFYDNFTVANTPEPASLALLGLGGLVMLSRRRNPDSSGLRRRRA